MPVTLTISSGSLNGVVTANTNWSGIAVFPNLDIPQAGTYTLTAVAGSLQTTSNPFTIVDSSLPAIESLSLASGDVGGGGKVLLSSSNFAGVTSVSFGGVAATSFTIDSNMQITAVAPPSAAGTVNVVVAGPQGESEATLTSQFSYVSAATFLVTNTLALGPGSLYEAVRRANLATSPATVLFDPVEFNSPRSITLAASLVLSNLTQPVTIQGPTTTTVTVSGNNALQLVTCNSPTTGFVRNLTLTQGYATLKNYGGAVYVSAGTVSIDNCVVSASSAGYGGGLATLYNGKLLIANCLVTGNSSPITSSGGGGGLFVGSGSSSTVSTATVINSLFTLNTTTAANGGGAVFVYGGAATLVNTTLSNNSAVVDTLHGM